MSLRIRLITAPAALLAVLLLCVPAHPQDVDTAGWHKRTHPYRLAIWTASQPESRTAYVDFHSGGKCQPDGRDILITDETGKDVPRRIMSAGPGDHLIVAFQMTDSSKYYLYFGSGAAFAPPTNWVPRAGLFLKTYRRPEGSSDTVEDFLKMLARVSVLDGAGYKDAVFDGYNRFGPSDDYVSVYNGFFNIKANGEYAFATNSDDSSMLYIDGKLVAQYPGKHGPAAVNGEKNGTVALRAGVHKLDYYHVDYSGGQATVAGWKQPGDKYFSLMPASAFVAIAPARLSRLEVQDGVIADFTYGFERIYPLKNKSGLVEMRFKQYSLPPDKIETYRWDFGDGEVSAEASPAHVYTAPGDYIVTLTAGGSGGEVSVASHPVRVFMYEGSFAGDLQKTRMDFRKELAAHRFGRTSTQGILNLIEFYSLEVEPVPERIVFFCRMILGRIPEEQADVRAEYMLKMADAMKADPRTGDYQQRSALYSSVVKTASADGLKATGSYELGDIALFYARDFKAARKWYESAVKLARDGKLKRMAQIRVADTSLYAGNLEEARKLYSEVPETVKGGGLKSILRTAYGQLVESYMRENKFRDALDALENWEWQYPEVRLDGYSFLLRIRINHRLNNLAEVTKYAYYILEVLDDPSYKPETYFIYISLLLQAGKQEDAFQQFRKLEDAFPNNFYTKRLKPHFTESR